MIQVLSHQELFYYELNNDLIILQNIATKGDLLNYICNLW